MLKVHVGVPDIQPLRLTPEINHLQSTLSDLSRLLNSGLLHIKGHVLDPNIGAVRIRQDESIRE